MQVIATFKGGALDEWATRLQGFENQAGLAEMLNAAGAEVRKATVATETAQTGLAADTIERAQSAQEAAPGRLNYVIRTRGGNVRLKYFGAKEGGGGVIAHPWGKQRFYPGAFIKSGRPGARFASSKLNGQVYEAVEASKRWGRTIEQVRSGLFIPTELTTGGTASAFEAGASRALTQLEGAIFSRLGA